jgi:hypothetical protein
VCVSTTDAPTSNSAALVGVIGSPGALIPQHIGRREKRPRSQIAGGRLAAGYGINW